MNRASRGPDPAIAGARSAQPGEGLGNSSQNQVSYGHGGLPQQAQGIQAQSTPGQRPGMMTQSMGFQPQQQGSMYGQANVSGLAPQIQQPVQMTASPFNPNPIQMGNPVPQ